MKTETKKDLLIQLLDLIQIWRPESFGARMLKMWIVEEITDELEEIEE